MSPQADLFESAFQSLTGHEPMPWQRQLYEEWFAQRKIPPVCTLPTGLGKTSVIAIWLIALAHGNGEFPHRLGNRRAKWAHPVN